MSRSPLFAEFAIGILCLAQSGGAAAQSRTTDNAVTQAEDAFGYSVGSESLGIYNSDNVRGFSPTAAGNIRIDGLYFDPVVGLSSLIVESQSIKVGLSAQGYPFPAPSGIVDQHLRRPADHLGASILTNADSHGSLGAEIDASVPLAPGAGIAVGIKRGRWHFTDGTTSSYHHEALIGRWSPSIGIEVLPFWSAFTDIDNNSSPTYLPAGEFIPPQPRSGHYTGPWWNGINRTQINFGLLTSAQLSDSWQLRVGAFRSLQHLRNGYTYLITDIQPDGSAHRTMFVNPPVERAGTSGEIRLTHTINDGPRLHLIHLSLRGRSNNRGYGGEDEVDLGESSIYQDINGPRPQFQFGPVSHDRLHQWLYGIAYDGRWKGVGELSFGVSRSLYRKTSLTPDDTIVARSSPLLYNASASILASHAVALYAGYSRGFEESGSPPSSAANRSEALPAILTSQVDGGVRVNLTSQLKAVEGLFDLSRPYFGFDSANRYVPIGTTRSRGAEFSVSGNLSDTLTLVAGGVILDARVDVPASLAADVGARPVGIPSHIFNFDADWKVRAVPGLSVNASLSERGRTPATTDNVVSLPDRAQVDLGARYAFSVGDTRASARVEISNLFDARGFGSAGPGAYYPNAARYASAYLTVDL
jgi:iron complex outermembrane receptor protein